MVQVNIKTLRVKERQPESPIFEPAEIPCGALTEVAIVEADTDSGRSTVALLIELPDGTKVMTKTTARIFNGINSAVKGALGSWGETF